jgi:hypothetical protein
MNCYCEYVCDKFDELQCNKEELGSSVPTIENERTMKGFAVTNTLREISPWPKMNSFVLQNYYWLC